MNKLLIAAALAAGAMTLPGLANAADASGAWKLATVVGDMKLHLDYAGATTSDTAMSGKLSVAGMDGTFTATKG